MAIWISFQQRVCKRQLPIIQFHPDLRISHKQGALLLSPTFIRINKDAHIVVKTRILDKTPEQWQFAIMVKTQIQFPDHLYREAKRIAEEYEMSFAEVVRRGLETVIKRYPPGRTPSIDWKPPVASDMGLPLLPENEWDIASRDDA